MTKVLPTGWEFAKLENVVDILDNKRIPVNAKDRAQRQGKVPYYGATGQVGWIDDFLFDEELILLGEDGAPFLDSSKQKAYIIRGKSWVNNHAHVLRTKNGIPNTYVKYYLDIVDYHEFVSGTTRLKLNQAAMREIPIPIAPPDQQKRIVAEIEKQFSRLDEAVANLKRIKANLKRYKAAVLKAAVEGKLTEAWRKEHLPAPTSRPGKFYTYAILCEDDSIYIGHTDDIERRWNEHLEGKGAEWTKDHKPVKIAHYEEFNSRQEAADREKWLKTGFGRKWIKRELAEGRTRQAGQIEPASKLLERILTERRTNWEKSELTKIQLRGVLPKDDNWKKRYKEAEPPKSAEIYPIPRSWIWTNLGQLSWSVKDGPHYSPKYSDSGIPFISGGNIRPEGIDFSTAKYISPELHAELSERCKPEFGDLLYTKGGTTGIARINTERKEFSVWVHIAVLKLVDSIKQFYLQHALNSLHCYRQSQKYTHGVGNQDLGLTRMIWVTVPLPPLQEQEQIVAEVERRMSVIDKLEAALEANLTRAVRFRQSILRQAFMGQLNLGFHTRTANHELPLASAPFAHSGERI